MRTDVVTLSPVTIPRGCPWLPNNESAQRIWDLVCSDAESDLNRLLTIKVYMFGTRGMPNSHRDVWWLETDTFTILTKVGIRDEVKEYEREIDGKVGGRRVW